MKPMKPSKKKTHPGMRLLSLLWLSALVAEAAAIEPGGFRDTFDSYTEIPKLLDFASQSFCGLGEHAHPRACQTLEIQSTFPVVGPLLLGGGADDIEYFYPWRTGITGKVNCKLTNEYGATPSSTRRPTHSPACSPNHSLRRLARASLPTASPQVTRPSSRFTTKPARPWTSRPSASNGG